MTEGGRETNGDDAADSLLPWLAALVTGLLSLVAFLLWGFNGVDLVIEMVAFYCG